MPKLLDNDHRRYAFERIIFLQTLPFYITNNIVRNINRHFIRTSKSNFLSHKRLAMHRWALMLLFHFIPGKKLLLLLLLLKYR